MTDLGHLIANVEENVGQAHVGATVPADALHRARRTVRRRRALRHAGQGAVAAVAAVAVAGTATWALQPRPVAADVASTAGPTGAAPTPAGEQLTLGAPVRAAVPRADVPVAERLAAAGPGWSLAEVSQQRLDAGPVMQPGDLRDVVTLVSPTGERVPLLDVPEDRTVRLTAWRPGSTTAVATVIMHPDTVHSGILDLVTGDVTPLPFEWEHHPLGLAATGESVWLDVPVPDEVRELLEADPGQASPVAPGALVAWEPEPPDSPMADMRPRPGQVRLVTADGVARDAGEAALPPRLHPLSPDGAWLAMLAPDGTLLGVDLRAGRSHPVAGAPTDAACRLAGWAGPHAVLSACPEPDGTWRLTALDVAADGGATPLGTSDVPVRDAWPLDDGRIGLGRVVQPAPCDVVSDPAVLEGGTVRSLTGSWSPYDHGTGLTFTGDALWTHINGCYPGSGRADPQRDVRVDLTTGEITATLAWLDDRRDAAHTVVDEDVWLVTRVDVVPGR